MDITASDIYTIEPPAPWIKDFQLPDVDVDEKSPLRFSIVEYQELIDIDALHSYSRIYQHVNDASKVEEASLQIVDLHLGSQVVIWHYMDIYRDGVKIDALDTENIRVIQRERSLEQHIVDNKITVSVSVDDLRVGDCLSYAYTVIENNSDHPFHGRHFCRTYSLSWGCPVDLQVIRIVNQRNTPLNVIWQSAATDYKNLVRETIESETEFFREFKNLPMERIPQSTPEWVWAAYLQVASKTTWREQSEYLADYFEQNQASKALDEDTVQHLSLFDEKDDTETKMLKVIRFVQNEIRYRGENHGVFTHTPKPATTTLKKRAGDCKDKSNLMMCLLNAIGIRARMVLVNTQYGSKVAELAPSPYQFDHMIVEVEHHDKLYYFDATIKNQAGDLDHCADLDYRYGLPIDKSGAELVDIERCLDEKVFHLVHTFDFREPSELPTLKVERTYLRHRADNMRGYFASNEKEKYQRDFLEWAMSDTGLKLESTIPIHVLNDCTTENCLKAEEEYKILEVERTHEDKPISLLTDFYQNFPLPNDDHFPARIDLDGMLEHRIYCKYKRRPELQTSTELIETSAFSYKDVVENIHGNTLHYFIKISPIKRFVEAGEDMQVHRKNVEKMQNRSQNLIRHRNRPSFEFGSNQLWWVCVVLYIAWVAYRNY